MMKLDKPFLVAPNPRPESHLEGSVLPDAQARQEALNPEVSYVIEAPAGSGKTGLLIQRYLRLLAHDNVTSPEQVLAITFTQKATEEIRQRVLSHLTRAASPELHPTQDDFDRTTRLLASAVLERDRQLAWNLLASPSRFNVRTIDSVCAEIARSLPVVSASGGATSPTTNQQRLYLEAARRTLLQLGGSDAALDSSLRTLVLHRDGNLEDCEKLIAEMLKCRDQWGSLVPLSAESLTEESLEQELRPRLERSLELVICSTLSHLCNNCPIPLLKQLATLGSEFATRPPYKELPHRLSICLDKHRPPQAVASDLDHWHALLHLLVPKTDSNWRRGFNGNHLYFERTTADRDKLNSLVQDFREHNHLLDIINRVRSLPPARYSPQQWTILKALFRVLQRALLELQLVFAQHGTCDFSEVSLLAMHALNRDDGPADLSSAWGMKLQHLLVDEMQDTSTSQYHLLELLTQSWDGHSQTVFLVGDPKQSIYLFRQARVERFLRMMHSRTLGDLRLQLLRLTANFRSRPALVETFNEDFSRIFTAQPEDGDDTIGYTRAIAVRKPAPSSAISPIFNWHIQILPAEPDSILRSRQNRSSIRKQAKAIRAVIERWRTTPLPPGRAEPWKIAVLVRNRKHLHDIVAALHQDLGSGPIPTRAIEIEALAERQEVLDLLALTRALLHRADRTAWLALLRAPWCGLELADLHLLAGSDQRELAEICILDLISDRGHLLPDGAAERLQHLWSVMARATQEGQQTTLSRWVEETWHGLGGDAYLTPQQLTNAQRYLRLLNETEREERPISSSTLQESLTCLYAEPSLQPGAVDLLTIHKAKGLEWDVVLIPAIHQRGRHDAPPLLRWEEISNPDKDSADLIFAPILSQGEDDDSLSKYLKSLSNARAKAERQRLYYVACTRAREELHLFAAPRRNASGEISPGANSLLEAAFPAVAELFSTSSTATAEDIEGSESSPLDLAAAATPAAPARTVERLPLESLRALQPAHNAQESSVSSSAQASNPVPEAPFTVRALGNTIHTFLDLAASELARGTSLAALQAGLASWQPRVQAVLRSAGLSPDTAAQRTREVLAALHKTLTDDTGAWILSPHPASATEFALISLADRRQSIRLDRTFRAGPEPLAPGQDHLWIIDYKTASHSDSGLENFLLKQRAFYAPQLELYAQLMRSRSPETEVRVALYYPSIPHLDWWIPAARLPLQETTAVAQTLA